jgi:alkanesulfonate monooxygenase SsuD/methylene tetrahydromethanopterin reductase-like flavin-dependent oxidoreductase (luciferase family)
MGYPLIVNPSRVFTLPELAASMEEYREAWRQAGHEGEGKVGLRVPIYVADTEEAAYEDPQESAMFSVKRLGNRVGSYATYGGTTGDWAAQSERILGMSYDDWFRDKVIYGTADSVAERLKNLEKELGLDLLIYEINYGNLMSIEMQTGSLKKFNQKVIPQLT